MLPAPVSFVQRGGFRRTTTYHGRTPRTLDVLLSRARITNLGVLLLAAVTALSLLYNLSYILFDGHASAHKDNVQLWNTLSGSVQRDSRVTGLTHLVIVPGHAVWVGSDPARVLDEDEWILEAYQRGGGRVGAFVQHIKGGVRLALEDESALLIFSGGQTRPTSPTSESSSYLRLAQSLSLLLTTFPRATIEPHALDSYQNLLFSIARFHEYTGRYPERITVVGYEMKRERFQDVHRAAVRWPQARFAYVGVDMESEGVEARKGELTNALAPYRKDLYGCRPPLSTKRRNRNPFARFHSYYTTAPELRALLDYCPAGATKVFDGPLPWDHL